ncbi:MAG: gfo/Idh/MocA family oxidoreductase [Planctomycetota bacterium]|nr:MAG: gfo/Idh/MocA family oxidoreductase [Planctomycetota bacterium]
MNEPKPSLTEPALTRRSFLKNASTAMAGGALLGALPIERFALGASPGDTIRIALIGAGGRGRGAAAQALRTNGDVKLVAVADAFKNSLEGGLKQIQSEIKDRPERLAVTEDTKFVGLDAYKKAIELADVVVIATPPGFRPIHFEEAVRQGKHVFMEKPVAVDGPGVRRVLAAAAEAKKRNLKVGVGLQRRHQNGYIETVKRLQDGEAGEILAMRVYWNGGPVGPKARRADLEKALGRPPTEMEYQLRNWYMFNWLCGDHIVEQHIHNLDVANWVLNGYPVRALGMGGRAYQKGLDSGEIFDHHAVQYEYANGVRVFSECRQIPGCWYSVSEHVHGTKGSSNVGNYTITGANAWKYRGGGKDPYQQEHDDLFDAIRNDKPYNEAERGALSSMTAILGRMCTNSGKEITWEEALNSKLDLMPSEFTWDAKPKVLPDENGIYPFAIPGKTVAV